MADVFDRLKVMCNATLDQVAAEARETLYDTRDDDVSDALNMVGMFAEPIAGAAPKYTLIGQLALVGLYTLLVRECEMKGEKDNG